MRALFDTTTGAEIGALLDGGQVMSLSFSPDGQRLAVVNHGCAELWNVRDVTDGLTLRGHGDAVLDVGFAPAGRELLSVANLSAPPAPDTGGFGQVRTLGGISQMGGAFGGGGMGALGGGLGALGGPGLVGGLRGQTGMSPLRGWAAQPGNGSAGTPTAGSPSKRCQGTWPG